MTAQIPEVLILESQRHAMCSEPLARCLRSVSTRVDFRPPNSSCWRGYVGTWEVIDGRLYLIELEGTLVSGEAANLATLFPGTPLPIFAHWYSGVARLPQGEMLEYVHGGYESTYERDLLLKFEAGVLVSREIKVNGSAENVEAASHVPQGDVLGWLLRSIRSLCRAIFR